MKNKTLSVSSALKEVRYEIRGALANRAQELERAGCEITKLNIGNPGQFGFRTPESMRVAVIKNLRRSEAYSHQKGIFPAREAIAMQQQERGVTQACAEHVLIGNGVSELIDLTLRALLSPGDEVLVPAPDYPLWTAATLLNGGVATHYPCLPENNFIPRIEDIRQRINRRTRAIVVINPNNPSGAVYPKRTLQQIVEVAEAHGLVILSDEIYDQMLYEEAQHVPLATLVNHTLCASYSGLSKVYRACGYRVGWVSFSGALEHAHSFLEAMELLASLRLCANVPGQWAVQTALGGYQSIYELTSMGGRLYESRQALIEAVENSPYLHLVAPNGAMYAFVGVNDKLFPGFDDHQFALDLLEHQHILIAPGSSFNVAYNNYFRVTLLPRANQMRHIFERVHEQLTVYRSKLPQLASQPTTLSDSGN